VRIKKGDKVIVIAGKDKGKTGAVLKAYPKLDKVVVGGVNISKRHERSRKGGQKGQTVEKTMPLHISNVMLMDPKGNKGTRVRIERKDGKRVRVAARSGTTL